MVITGPTRNRLSWETGTVGSNPTLSAILEVKRETLYKRSRVGDIGLMSALYFPNSGRDARAGLRGTTGNRVCAQKVYRGFESLSLRHNSYSEQGDL